MIKNDDMDVFKELFYILSNIANSACYIWFGALKAENLYKDAFYSIFSASQKLNNK